MKKLRIFTVMILCMALLTFAGCGDSATDENADNGSVLEETTEKSDGNKDGDSITDDMVEDASDAADGVKENNGNSKSDPTKVTENN